MSLMPTDEDRAYERGYAEASEGVRAELIRLTALVAEQQRQIEELEKERDAAKQAASDYDKDCIDMRYQRDLAAARLLALQSSARQMKEALEPLAAMGRGWVFDPQYVANARAALQSSARQMKEALEFYGDSKNYEARIVDGDVKEGIASEDDGAIARSALQSAASLDLGPDWRKEAEKLAERSAAVVVNFKSSEAQGYRSRDRQYAIDMLEPAINDFNRTKGGGDENA